MKNNRYILGLIVVVVIGLGGIYLLLNKKSPSISYSCAEGKTINTSFVDEKMTKIVVRLDNTREFELDRAMAASGTRYTNKDESVVFWSKGTTAFLTEQNTETYSDCVEKINQ